MKRTRIIGLMSGTSHDGVDAALVDVRERAARSADPSIKVELISYLHVPYGKRLREEISDSFQGTGEQICRLNFRLGEIFAGAVQSLLDRTGMQPGEIDAIASHGQTVCHIPPRGRKPGSTLQIGEASVIADRTGILTLSDFRTRDMAVGGQGAPLVPLTDYLLFAGRGECKAAVNIGGIANVSILRDRLEDTIAFDIGPGNALIDEAVKLSSGGRRAYDRSGDLARSGRPDAALLRELSGHPYFRRRPPKTTGRETFGKEMVQSIFRRYGNLRPRDIIATFTLLTSGIVCRSVLSYRPHEVIFSGGGVRNAFLMEQIRETFGRRGIGVSTVSAYGYPPEAKEAVSFAVLGYQTLKMRHGNVPSATGARSGVILGKITPP